MEFRYQHTTDVRQYICCQILSNSYTWYSTYNISDEISVITHIELYSNFTWENFPVIKFFSFTENYILLKLFLWLDLLINRCWSQNKIVTNLSVRYVYYGKTMVNYQVYFSFKLGIIFCTVPFHSEIYLYRLVIHLFYSVISIWHVLPEMNFEIFFATVFEKLRERKVLSTFLFWRCRRNVSCKCNGEFVIPKLNGRMRIIWVDTFDSFEKNQWISSQFCIVLMRCSVW